MCPCTVLAFRALFFPCSPIIGVFVAALSITFHFIYKLVDKVSPSCRAALELMV